MKEAHALKGYRGFFISAILLWLAGGCQESVANRLTLGGITPDLLLVTLGVLAVMGTRQTGAITGFFAGMIQGAMSGANMAQYVVSRTIIGFFIGWFNSLDFEANTVVAFFAVVLTTCGSQFLLMFLAPPSRIFAFLIATIGVAVYNGVLAMPLFALLKRITDPSSR